MAVWIERDEHHTKLARFRLGMRKSCYREGCALSTLLQASLSSGSALAQSEG